MALVIDVEARSVQGSNPGRDRAAAFTPQCKGTAPSCGHLSHLLPHHSGSSGNFVHVSTYHLRTSYFEEKVQLSDLLLGF